MVFINFILKDRRNKSYAIIALAGSIALFTIFKILYPFPDFFSDSYSYIFAAKANLDVSIWPIGYSKFLRWFHFITYSDTALITFQYFFYIFSALYFFFTILFFYCPIKAAQGILFIFLFFNPLFLYVCNYVNSDPLFLALSLLWFTELLWIMQRPNIYHIIAQAILLVTCFIVRNNAYIYPFLTIIALVLAPGLSWIKKGIALSIGILLLIPFIVHTQKETYKMTGKKQFSLFTGWQLANNALYAYEYMDSAKILPIDCQELEKSCMIFFHRIPTEKLHDIMWSDEGNFFIRAYYGPLKQYFTRHYKISDDYDVIVAWGKASIVFETYGIFLIKNNFRAFVWAFILPNAKNYFIPTLEKLSVYNLGSNKFDPVAEEWFHFKNPSIKISRSPIQGIILYFFPIIFCALNIYTIIQSAIYIISKKYLKQTRSYRNAILLFLLFLSLNFIFLTTASIIVFRYQLFPMIICLVLAMFLSENREAMQNANIKSPSLEK